MYKLLFHATLIHCLAWGQDSLVDLILRDSNQTPPKASIDFSQDGMKDLFKDTNETTKAELKEFLHDTNSSKDVSIFDNLSEKERRILEGALFLLDNVLR